MLLLGPVYMLIPHAIYRKMPRVYVISQYFTNIRFFQFLFAFYIQFLQWLVLVVVPRDAGLSLYHLFVDETYTDNCYQSH
jgi:hypothetical protein